MKEYLRKGYDIKFIRSSLIKAGVPRSKLDQAHREIADLRRPKPKKKPIIIKKKPKKPFFTRKKLKKPLKSPPRPLSKPFMKTKAFRPKPTGIFWKVFLPLIIIAILIISLLVVFAASQPKDCGTDADCFIGLANACKPAKFRNVVDTTGISYVTKDCKLTKKIISLSPDEPKEVVDLFLGLSMTCNYRENMFTRLYIDEISGELETCSGSLATVIRELRR